MKCPRHVGHGVKGREQGGRACCCTRLRQVAQVLLAALLLRNGLQGCGYNWTWAALAVASTGATCGFPIVTTGAIPASRPVPVAVTSLLAFFTRLGGCRRCSRDRCRHHHSMMEFVRDRCDALIAFQPALHTLVSADFSCLSSISIFLGEHRKKFRGQSVSNNVI